LVNSTSTATAASLVSLTGGSGSSVEARDRPAATSGTNNAKYASIIRA
jgi:hypothetical protein